MRRARWFGGVLGVIALWGCRGAQGPAPFQRARVLGGLRVTAQALDRGRAVYTRSCLACHGASGQGNGPASSGLDPPPRDFTRGIFKFGATLPRDGAPTLPTDADLERVIRGDMHGSATLSWNLSSAELADVVQYLKTFSPRWRTEVPGAPLVPGPDPWAGQGARAIAQGRALYHGLAKCSSCHAAYATRAEITSFVKLYAPGAAPPSFRARMFASTPVDAVAFSVDGAHPLRILPPDFLHARLKSIRARSELPDLYRVIALGIDGAGMPPWRDALTPAQIWAIAHYVRSLIDSQGTPAARELEAELAADAEARRRERASGADLDGGPEAR